MFIVLLDVYSNGQVIVSVAVFEAVVATFKIIGKVRPIGYAAFALFSILTRSDTTDALGWSHAPAGMRLPPD